LASPEEYERIVEDRTARLAELPLVEFGKRGGFFSDSWSAWADVWAHRELLLRLVKREVKARYKDSSLGILWSLFRPLVQLLIYYFAIGQILGAARGTPNFAIFVFIGLTTWMLFSDIVNGATMSILANSGLVKKVYLPREIFPLSTVGSSLVNFAFQLIVLVGGILLLSSFPGGTNILLAPLAIVTLIVFSTAIGLLLSALNVYVRDVQHFVEVALAVLFWLSPIVYPFRYVHTALGGNWMEQLYLLNPITTIVISMQKALWSAGTTPEGLASQVWPDHLVLRLLITLAASLVFLWFSQRIFARLQGNFAQEI
jgi:ABC-2 type transport system permease protein